MKNVRQRRIRYQQVKVEGAEGDGSEIGEERIF